MVNLSYNKYLQFHSVQRWKGRGDKLPMRATVSAGAFTDEVGGQHVCCQPSWHFGQREAQLEPCWGSCTGDRLNQHVSSLLGALVTCSKSRVIGYLQAP